MAATTRSVEALWSNRPLGDQPTRFEIGGAWMKPFLDKQVGR